MQYYKYMIETYTNDPRGRERMGIEVADLGDQGWRVHTILPISNSGGLIRYEVLYECECERE